MQARLIKLAVADAGEIFGTNGNEWEPNGTKRNDSERLGKFRKVWESFKNPQIISRQSLTYFGVILVHEFCSS